MTEQTSQDALIPPAAEGDLVEQQLTAEPLEEALDEEDEVPELPLPLEADPADALEQQQVVPELDDYS